MKENIIDKQLQSTIKTTVSFWSLFKPAYRHPIYSTVTLPLLVSFILGKSGRTALYIYIPDFKRAWHKKWYPPENSPCIICYIKSLRRTNQFLLGALYQSHRIANGYKLMNSGYEPWNSYSFIFLHNPRKEW